MIGRQKITSLFVSVAAYIPVRNQSGTLREALQSLRDQTFPIDEILVINDGSTDEGVAAICGQGDIKLFENGTHLGRGATRARAMEKLCHEFVLCCDSTNAMEPQFLEKAMEWMADPNVGAVYGRIRQKECRSTADRWRAAHLFREAYQFGAKRGDHLSTWGALVRRSAVMTVGNYDPRLTHSEDRDLGIRLGAAGFVTVADPRICVHALKSNTVREVMERYWRWNAGAEQRVSIASYLRLIKYSVTEMALEDLRAGDWKRVWMTLLCPHYQYWRSRLSGLRIGGCLPSDSRN